VYLNKAVFIATAKTYFALFKGYVMRQLVDISVGSKSSRHTVFLFVWKKRREEEKIREEKRREEGAEL